eukprot:6470564-Amphidinium_carterae.1
MEPGSTAATAATRVRGNRLAWVVRDTVQLSLPAHNVMHTGRAHAVRFQPALGVPRGRLQHTHVSPVNQSPQEGTFGGVCFFTYNDLCQKLAGKADAQDHQAIPT